MKTKFVLLAFVAVLVMTVGVVRADYLISDMESGSGSENWGLYGTGTPDGWQGLSIGTVAGTALGAPTTWGKMGIGTMTGTINPQEGKDPAWNPTTTFIRGWYEDWGNMNINTYNQHSQYEFDAIVFSDSSWASNTLSVKMRRDILGGWGSSQMIPQAGQDWQTYDVSGLKTNPDPEIQPFATIIHFTIPYTDVDAVQIPLANDFDNGNTELQLYFDFTYNPAGGTDADGPSYVYIDNLKLSGDPLPVPEPATIVMLALAGLMGLLYWRKR